MHELAVAQSIIQTVSSHLENKNIRKVSRIYVTLGVLSGVEKGALLESFSLMPKQTLFHTTALKISECALAVYCDNCKRKSTIKNGFRLQCASCGKRTSRIIKGTEMTIDRITYE